jgi:uncharacterized YccA/Bax inhibitor family protein
MISQLLASPSTSGSKIEILLTLVTYLLGAAMVVVAFARKKEAQPILSIEDFYEGLFIGFLCAYGGNALLNKIASP